MSLTQWPTHKATTLLVLIGISLIIGLRTFAPTTSKEQAAAKAGDEAKTLTKNQPTNQRHIRSSLSLTHASSDISLNRTDHGNEKQDSSHQRDTAAVGGIPAYEVCIIGAGWAGVGAAKTLMSRGKTNFTVLEARSYIGGRSRTILLSDNITSVDLGSSWVHGVTSNPVQNAVLQLKQGYKMSAETEGYWSSAFTTSPGRIPDSTMSTFINNYWDGTNGFFPYQAKRQNADSVDKSLRAVADDYINLKGIQSGANRNGFEFLLHVNIMQDYAASVEDLSLWWWDDDSELGGGDSYLAVNKASGYGPVIQGYAAGFSNKIALNSVVTSINYSSNPVVVNYIQNGSIKQLHTKKVILTVPLGVLQSGTIKFTPALPTSKQTAISSLGMGLMNKVVLLWPNNTKLPWPTSVEWVQHIQPLANKSKWEEFYNPSSLNGGRPMIIAFSVGREAARVENLTDTQIKNEVLTSLRIMFGASNVPEPRQVLITRWGKDPYSKGSYSYLKVNARPQHRINLQATVNNLLYFAGEATHSLYPSTTHGALNSGITAGNAV